MNFLRRLFHRHRWELNSHALIPYEASESYDGVILDATRSERWKAVATVQCACGKREFRQSPGYLDGFLTREAAMCLVRAQCHDTVPDGVPQNLDAAPTRKP